MFQQSETVPISDSDVRVIKETPVTRHNCVVWTEQRKECLTTSLFHDVFKPTTNLLPLLKKIMGYEQSDSPSIRGGVQNENAARGKYTTLTYTEHENFTRNLTGLWINPLYPHLRVSPDGVTSCSCHEMVVGNKVSFFSQRYFIH